eukprot:gnl/TRDRNA2_/TRDRNA2_125756_c4_seq1.p2 gnl/TRDRNA2_/TRDRNA2_125756_c4~~gnl/TRDRNA2_/TRDRNA2_125756_c4_seq1.p2  ORF type:complete len:138 (-),score=17.10 gnl/TRDRNA2_/TRDRNA2_125756_c4_seq1:81-494(-)
MLGVDGSCVIGDSVPSDGASTLLHSKKLLLEEAGEGGTIARGAFSRMLALKDLCANEVVPSVGAMAEAECASECGMETLLLLGVVSLLPLGDVSDVGILLGVVVFLLGAIVAFVCLCTSAGEDSAECDGAILGGYMS